MGEESREDALVPNTLPTRHDAPSRAMAKKRATTTPFLRSKVEGTGSRGNGGPSAPAPPSTEFEDRKKKNERTNEGPRKQRGAFDFRRMGVSIYSLQLSLFRMDFQSVFATLNLKRSHAHRKICLPKPAEGGGSKFSHNRRRLYPFNWALPRKRKSLKITSPAEE